MDTIGLFAENWAVKLSDDGSTQQEETWSLVLVVSSGEKAPLRKHPAQTKGKSRKFSAKLNMPQLIDHHTQSFNKRSTEPTWILVSSMSSEFFERLRPNALNVSFALLAKDCFFWT